MVPQPLWSSFLQVVYKTDNAPRIEFKNGVNLIDIIENNFRSMSVENAALSTRPLLYETFQKQESNNEPVIPTKTDQNIQEYVNPLLNNTNHPALSKAIVDWFDLQSKILHDSYIDQNTKIAYIKPIAGNDEGLPLMPYKALINKMIDLVFATVVSDYIILGDWEIDSLKEKELVDFIKDSMESFGGLSIYIGAWNPGEEDKSSLIRKMELLASVYSVDFSRGYKLTPEGKRIFVEI